MFEIGGRKSILRTTSARENTTHRPFRNDCNCFSLPGSSGNPRSAQLSTVEINWAHPKSWEDVVTQSNLLVVTNLRRTCWTNNLSSYRAYACTVLCCFLSNNPHREVKVMVFLFFIKWVLAACCQYPLELFSSIGHILISCKYQFPTCCVARKTTNAATEQHNSGGYMKLLCSTYSFS